MKHLFTAAMLFFALFDAFAGDSFEFTGTETLQRIRKELKGSTFSGLTKGNTTCFVAITENADGMIYVTMLNGVHNDFRTMESFDFKSDDKLISFLSGDEYVSNLQIIKKVGTEKAYLQIRNFDEEFGAPGTEVVIYPLGDIQGAVKCSNVKYN